MHLNHLSFAALAFAAAGLLAPTASQAQVSAGGGASRFAFGLDGSRIGQVQVIKGVELWSFDVGLLASTQDAIEVTPVSKDETIKDAEDWWSPQGFELEDHPTLISAEDGLVFRVELGGSELRYFMVARLDKEKPAFEWFIHPQDVSLCDDGAQGCAIDFSKGGAIKREGSSFKLKAYELAPKM